MRLVSVESDNISQIGFERNRKLSMGAKPVNVLRVIFINGSVYDYYNAEEQLFLDFLHSDSKGKFLHSHIVDKYDYEKIK